MTAFTATLYLVLLGLLQLHGLHKLVQLARFRRRVERQDPELAPAERPFVTVQLPLYDERTVARRLLRAVGELDWPRERLELQVLDDSDDETRAIVDEEARALRGRGLAVEVVRRGSRAGYKAGALALGLSRARGELLCVFDADFLPPPDFLRRATAPLRDPRVGMVQARWAHLERDASLFARAQAVLLDGHFVIEHRTRCDHGLFFNFNGTAGIWRRAAILEAGGWQADTLTEDLDLSYRAQLAGWRFAYLDDCAVEAELPGELSAFASQQHRWAKGSTQVVRKLAGRLARSRERAAVKLEALAHLGANVGYPCMLGVALLLPYQMLSGEVARLPAWAWIPLLASPAAVLAFYARSQRALARSWRSCALDTLAAVALGVGMSWRQTCAVLAGLGPRTGAFVRTPKRGAQGARGYACAGGALPGIELGIALWIAAGCSAAALRGQLASLPFLALFAAGFAWVGTLALRESLARRRAAGGAAASGASLYPRPEGRALG